MKSFCIFSIKIIKVINKKRGIIFLEKDMTQKICWHLINSKTG